MFAIMFRIARKPCQAVLFWGIGWYVSSTHGLALSQKGDTILYRFTTITRNHEGNAVLQHLLFFFWTYDWHYWDTATFLQKRRC